MTTDSTGYRCALEIMEGTMEHTKSAYLPLVSSSDYKQGLLLEMVCTQ